MSVPHVQTVPLVENFFLQHFPICWLIGISSCWNVSSCCVHVHTCAVGKKTQKERCLSRTTQRHQSKKQTKRIIHAGAAKKMLLKVETDSESSKNMNPGEMLQAGLSDGRRPRCPLSLGMAITRSRSLAKENTCSRSFLVAVLCARISMLAPQQSLNKTRSFHRRKSFVIASYPFFFFHHYDWN